MNIKPITPYKHYSFNNKTALENIVPPSSHNYASLPIVSAQVYKANFLPFTSFKGSDKLATEIENNITSQLSDKTTEDIDSIIKNVANKSACSEEKAREIVSRLTQFTSYSQLKTMLRQIGKHDVNVIYDDSKYRTSKKYAFTSFFHEQEMPTINNILLYLGLGKININFPKVKIRKVSEYLFLSRMRKSLPQSTEQLDKEINSLKNYNEIIYKEKLNKQKNAFILDDFSLQLLEEKKKNDPDNYAKFLMDAKDGFIKFFVIDGWSAKANGEDVSYTMFGAPDTLEESAIKIANEHKYTGKSIDDILNRDITERTKYLLGYDVPINVIKNPQVQNKSNMEIANILANRKPTKEHIKKTLDEVLSNTKEKFGYIGNEKISEYLSEYFNNELHIYSSETMSKASKEIYEKINEFAQEHGKTMDDVIYYIPLAKKSFTLMTYQYAKSNRIDLNKIANKDTKDVNYDNKIVVLLDDFIGSGDSFLHECFNYKEEKKDKFKNSNLIFAPLLCTFEGEGNIIFERNSNADTVICDKLQDSSSVKLFKRIENDLFDRNLTPNECKSFWNTLFEGFGHDEGKCCVAFPFTMPDNNSKLSNKLLEPCVIK